MVIKSIKTFLIINLLLCISLIVSFVIILNLFIEHHLINKHLDNATISTANIIKYFVNNNIKHDIKINLRNRSIFITNKTNNKTRNLKQGFNTYKYNKKLYRIFLTTKNKKKIIIYEPYATREKIITTSTENSVLMLIIMYPILAFIIWIILSTGLSSINDIANKIEERAKKPFTIISMNNIPSEISPLINELNSLFIKLNETKEREQRFAIDAAHELKTPLAALKIHADLALKTTSLDEKNTHLQQLISSLKRSIYTVQQLLLMNKVTYENKSNKKNEKIDLEEEVAQQVTLLINEANRKNITIELKVLTKNKIIFGNKFTIPILIKNIIDNSIKYTQKNGNIIIILENVKKHHDQTILKVIDNGKGIPEQYRKRVFDLFYRVPENNTIGCGLGLGIVKEIADAHEAKIKILTPQDGKGTEFKIVFQNNFTNNFCE